MQSPARSRWGAAGLALATAAAGLAVATAPTAQATVLPNGFKSVGYLPSWAGSVNAVRYRTSDPDAPRYLCAYEVENTTLPMSKLWNDTSDIGRWKPEVRPYTYNKRYIVSERILSM